MGGGDIGESERGAGRWVGYQELKERVSMQDVLDWYGVDWLKGSGQNLVGYCPIHHGKNSRQFTVNLEKNVYYCFGDCKGGGNIFNFVAKKERVSIREAALLIQEWFPGSTEDQAGRVSEAPARLQKRGEPQGELVNKPLTFELKNLSADHPFFTERGIKPETVAHFGLGYCEKGMMKGRVVIPIHNESGELVAYCGRAVTEAQIEDEGKYKLPPGFHKKLVVYNLSRQKQGSGSLILVESYLSVFRLWQAGYANAVALMGSFLSNEQERLLVQILGSEGRLVLMFDDDEGGEWCAGDCLRRFSRSLFVKVVDISRYARKPHGVSEEDLRAILG